LQKNGTIKVTTEYNGTLSIQGYCSFRCFCDMLIFKYLTEKKIGITKKGGDTNE